MINLPDTLADQLKLASDGGAWHGPSLREALDGVTAAEAVQHPIPGAHSIWELVLHIRATCELVRRRTRGNSAQLTPEEDWPLVPEATEENWKRDVAAAFEASTRLQNAVRAFPSDDLGQPLLPNPPYTAFTQFIGITQHDVYHAGQIVLLRKMLKSHTKNG